MQTGQQFYERGSYAEAEKNFQMAQGYAEYLDPAEQRKLESWREKASLAATERERVLVVRQTGEQLRAKGELAAARAQLESIKSSEYLTEKERADVATALRALGQPAPANRAAGAQTAPGTARPQPGASDTLNGPASSVHNVYYDSVKAYQSGDFKTAKEGFKKVLGSGLLPVPMAETVRGYLAEIQSAEAKQGNGQTVGLPAEAGRAVPVAAATALSGEPAQPVDPNAPAGQPDAEKKRIADLYVRSWELYSQGDLAAARKGFVEVAASGLFTAAEGKRPEDYIATIDRLLATSEPNEPPAAQPGQTPAVAPPQTPTLVVPPEQGVTPAAPPEQGLTPVVPLPQVPAPAAPLRPTPIPVGQSGITPLAAAPSTGDEGGSIDAINRRRNIICSHCEAVVNDAVGQAQQYVAKGDFALARDRVDGAQRTVDESQAFLGDDLYKQHTLRLTDMTTRISEAQTAQEKQQTEVRRQAAAAAHRALRTQVEIDRQKRIDELLERAKAYWKQQQYEQAQGQLETLLKIEPLHDEALTLKQMVDDMMFMRDQIEVDKESKLERAKTFLETERAQIAHAKEVEYAKDWREIIARPTRQPDQPGVLDPENKTIRDQLEKMVDLSRLQPTTPLRDAIEIVRNSVQPPLNIVVLWRDLEDNAQLNSTDPINMDGLPNVMLSTGLDSLLNALSSTAQGVELGYVVRKGVITIATRDALPKQTMETRVYDVSDLVGEPANYFQMGMMGVMGGMMGGMGGYGGGMGMGGMGGYGGGMMGGMGGYGGGMGMGGMGGYGGGMMGGAMGGMGMGGMGGMGMGGMGMGGMGGYGGGMGMGGMGGMGMGGMGMGGMGGYGMGGMGMGGMGGYGMGGMSGGNMSMYIAQSLKYLIEQSIDMDTWYDMYPEEPGADGTIVVYPDQQPKKLAVYQTPEVHRKIEELLDSLRKSLAYAVSIEARFLVVTENFLEDIGLDFDLSYNTEGKWGVITMEQESATGARVDTTTKVPGSLGGLADNPAAQITANYGNILDDLQVNLLLRATQARSDSRALAAPKVTVLSGESATFSLQDMISYALPPQTGSTTFSGGGAGGGFAQQTGTQNQVNMLPAGSQLSIIPTITKDKKYVLLNIVTQQADLLRMRTHQVSVISQSTTETIRTTITAPEVVQYPVTVPEMETANIMTRVSVPDRGTLLLGGHKLTAEVDKEEGVPVLSKIPLIGRLFSNRSTIRDEKVLLVLVKPTILLNEEEEQQAIAGMSEAATTEP